MRKEELIYIAGFLDGDGCIMVQLISRKDYRLGYEIRPSIVFYQKNRNKNFLIWLKSKLKVGYVRDRNDNMSEYDIVGKKPVMNILIRLLPFLRLKEKQGRLTLSILRQIPETGREMTAELLYKLSKEIDKFALLNYSKKRINTSKKVKRFLESHHLLSP